MQGGEDDFLLDKYFLLTFITQDGFWMDNVWVTVFVKKWELAYFLANVKIDQILIIAMDDAIAKDCTLDH